MDINKMLAKPNETIREHTDKLIKQAKLLNQLGYISSKTIYSDLLCACEYHDYGKGNSEFQKRIVRYNRFNPYKEIPHSVLSVFFVDESKCNDYAGVCFANNMVVCNASSRWKSVCWEQKADCKGCGRRPSVVRFHGLLYGVKYGPDAVGFKCFI